MTVTDGAWLRPRRLPGRLGAVGISRLLAFQVIQLGLFVVLVQGPMAAVLGGMVGALAIGGTFARWQGRWVTDTALLWLRHRRRRGVVGSGHEDPRLAALGELVPDLVVEDVDGGQSAPRLGMGSDGGGWYAVVEVEPGEPEVDPPVPLSALSRIAADAGVAGVVVQVVSQTAPASGAGTGEKERTLWVAVRIGAEALAESMVDDPERHVDVPAVLGELARRVRRALARRGISSRVLDADGVISALVRSCDLTAAGARSALAQPVQERWREWGSHRLAHRCFWLQTWPDPDRGTALLASLAELPGAQVSISLLLEPRYETVEADLRCLIRISTTPGRCDELGDFAELLAARQGSRLAALDGEQALGVYASAPSGGGAR